MQLQCLAKHRLCQHCPPTLNFKVTPEVQEKHNPPFQNGRGSKRSKSLSYSLMILPATKPSFLGDVFPMGFHPSKPIKLIKTPPFLKFVVDPASHL